MHWGSYVEVPNSTSISCTNSSLLECSPVTQETRVQLQAKTRLSRGALIEDGDDLGQVSLLLSVVISWINGLRTFCFFDSIVRMLYHVFRTVPALSELTACTFLVVFFNKDSYIEKTLLYISLYGRSMTNSSHPPFFCLSAWVSIFLFVLWALWEVDDEDTRMQKQLPILSGRQDVRVLRYFLRLN